MEPGFLVSGQLWAVIKEADEDVEFAMVADEQGLPAIVLLTDQDLAERYAKGRGPEYRPYNLSSLQRATTILKDLVRQGITLAALDPGKSARFKNLESLIDDIEKHWG